MVESISKAAEDLIIEQEVSSQAVYIKKYQHPEWPGGASGVTVGIGYDCGYSTSDQIQADWEKYLDQETINKLKHVAGVSGNNAAGLVKTATVHSIIVPWDAALGEFEGVEVPKWLKKVRAVYPNTENLPPDCLGALVSLAYNRGLALTGDRRREMKNIRDHLANKEFDKIPQEFRSMKRLWNNGLVRRREEEAQLFEKGLAEL